MAIALENREQLEAAIAQLKAEIAELEGCIPNWISENTIGTRRYRPISRRIVLSAKRVGELVRENTY